MSRTSLAAGLNDSSFRRKTKCYYENHFHLAEIMRNKAFYERAWSRTHVKIQINEQKQKIAVV